MTVRPEVVNYLRIHCEKYADGALRERLIKDGVLEKEVDDAFAIINLTRTPTYFTDRGRAQQASPAITVKKPPKSGLKKLLIFAAGAVFFGAIISTELLLRKLRSPETQQMLARLQKQADAFSQPQMRDALAAKKYPARTVAREDAFASYAQLAYRSLVSRKHGDAARFADMALEAWSKKLHGAQNKKALLGIRARAHELSGNSTQALNDYQALADLDPEDIEGLLGRGRIFLAKSYYKSAAGEAKKIIAAAPERTEGHTLAAAAYMQLGRPRRALQSFSYAIRTQDAEDADPEKAGQLANLHYNRAVLLANDRKFRLALTDLSRAIALSPDVSPYYRARAQVYRAVGKRRSAAADDRKADALGSSPAPTGPDLGLGATLTRPTIATVLPPVGHRPT